MGQPRSDHWRHRWAALDGIGDPALPLRPFVPAAWGSAGVETGENLDEFILQAEEQAIGEPPKAGSPRVFAYSWKLLGIV